MTTTTPASVRKTTRTQIFTAPVADAARFTLTAREMLPSQSVVTSSAEPSYTFEVGKLTALTGSFAASQIVLSQLGLLKSPPYGWIELGGVDTATLTDGQRARLRATRFGYVFRSAHLRPGSTVVESVMEPGLYAGRTHRDVRGPAMALLWQFGLEALAHQRTNQIPDPQRRAITLCRALINDPDIILADHPTESLDGIQSARVIAALTEAAHKSSSTVVVATKNPSFIAHADVVVAV